MSTHPSIVANSQLENHFHSRFADVRCSADSFLYIADNLDHYADLENFCDEMQESKSPLLVLGEKGVGKSALLANWTIRRKRNRRKNAFLSSSTSHEMLFWHAVGCTRNSAKVDVMLRRLMTELKKRFDLTLEVPFRNDRLSWDLPRFLEQSSKKGCIIIVVDGIHLLTTEDGTEAGLTWLPLDIPSNVRFIVSVSSHTPLPEPSLSFEILTEDMMSPKRPRFINEVNRRQWHVLRMRPHEFSLVRTIMMHYFHKTVEIDADNHNKFDSFITSLPLQASDTLSAVDGFVLFPSQVEDVMRHKCSCFPIFLRTLLESAALVSEAGHCLWTTLSKWLTAESYPCLVKHILRSFEEGFSSDDRVVERARNKVLKQGGINALRILYPWHPNFAVASKVDATHSSSRGPEHRFERVTNSAENGREDVARTATIQDSLENPLWIAAMQEAGLKLQDSFSVYTSSACRVSFTATAPSIPSQSQSTSDRRQSLSKQVQSFVNHSVSTDDEEDSSLIYENFDLSSISHLCNNNIDGNDQQNGHPRLTANTPVRRPSFMNLVIKVESTSDTEEISRIPSYLVGGRSCVGLGTLLGNALALLYTSYRGLTENELWIILMQLKAKETQSNASSNVNATESRIVFNFFSNRGAYEDIWRSVDIHRKGKVTRQQFVREFKKIDSLSDPEIEILLRIANIGNIGSQEKIDYIAFIKTVETLDRQYRVAENSTRLAPLQHPAESLKFDDNLSVASLGPILETALCLALKCIGVLRSSEYAVLVLPVENYMLRNAIFEEFVVPRGGLDYWHNVLASYFNKLPSTLRRSEELPWHLESTRKWYLLKDTLADLKTFDIMSTSDLCAELMKYWHLLTHGPLHTRNLTEKDRKSSSADDDGQTALLQNIELSVKLGLAESVTKRMLMKDKISTFDIVEVYNKSIEKWVDETSPTSSDIHSKLAMVGSFLIKFSQSANEFNAFPPYLRLPLDSKELGSLSLGYSDLKFSQFDSTPADVDKDGSKLQLEKYYFSRRWMWIQFPWFALKFKIELEELSESKRLQQIEASNATLIATGNIPVQRIDKSSSTLRSLKSDHMRGFWDIKCTNPSPSFDKNSNQKNGRSKQRQNRLFGMQEYPIVNFSLETLFPPKKLKPLHKFRRSLKETVESSSHALFAMPSYRSLKNNTLFPSTGRDLLNRHLDILRHEKDPFVLAAAAARVGDKRIPADIDLFTEIQNIYTSDINRYSESAHKETTFEEETANLTKIRALADKALFVLAEKKVLLAQLKFEYHERSCLDSNTSGVLTEGEEAIVSLEKKCELAIQSIAEAEQMNRGYAQVLHVCEHNPSHTKHHLHMIEQELRLSKQQLHDLMQFRHNIYAEASKNDIQGSKFIEDQARYYESMKASTTVKKERQMHMKRDLQLSLLRASFQKEEIPGYFDFNDDEYAEEASRLRHAWKDETLADYNRDAVHYRGTKTFIEQLASRTHLPNDAHDAGFDPPLFTIEDDDDILRAPAVDSLADAKISQIISDHKRVLNLTNSKTIDELCRRFKEGQNLHANLTSQGSMAENKVVLLRSELSKLTDFLVDITLSSNDETKDSSADYANDNKEDSRALDDKLIRKQLYLNQIVRQTEQSEILINEVRVALTNLIALLEANSGLMSALPQKPAPPLLSNADIGEALAWCEDKVIAISEVLLYDTSKLAAKPAGSKWQKLDVTDDSQPLPERQVELAALMEGLLMKDLEDNAQSKNAKVLHNKKNKKKIGLSRAALNNKESRIVELKSPRAVMVPPLSTFDSEYESKTMAILSKQDSSAELQATGELFNPDSIKQKEALEMSEFLTSALSSHDALFMTKQQNRIRLQMGNNSVKTRGWVVDSLLQQKNLQEYVAKIELTAPRISSKTKFDVKSILTKHDDDGKSVPSRSEIKAKASESIKFRNQQQRLKEAKETVTAL